MSLVSYLNKSCPVGVSHYHGPSEEVNDRIECCLCVDNQERQNFCWYCPNYINRIELKLNNQQLLTLNIIFSKEEFWLPNELRDIIFEKSIFTLQESLPIHLNEKGIDHIYGCRKCSRKFLEFLDKHSCSGHIIPRISENDYRDILF